MPLFGVETEYGLAAPGADADPQRNVSAAQDLVTDLRRSVPALDAASGSGIFLGNGMRVYVDLVHLEVATPEVTDPVDAVRFTLAGDRVLERAVARCCPDRARAPMLFKANVSCLLNRASWGCHENILYRADTPDPREALIPHLVSRICYAGSGGLDPSSPGLAFAVSPRALFLEQARSAETMKRRGIVDTKEEPLRAPQYRRLHLIAGEPLSGEIGSYLKIATTVVVVAMIEAGVAPRDAVALADPVAALHAVARDPSCRTEVQLAQGGQATATTIQRSFLEAAETHLGASFMPSWAPALCREWRRILDILDRDPAAACTVLDWAIKRALFSRVLARHRLDWPAVAAWTDALRALWTRLRPGDSSEAPPDPEVLRERRMHRRARQAGAVSILRAHGMRWLDLPRFLAARRSLCECDIRFGELGERGLFRQLDREGVLHHHVPGVEDIDLATEQPPATGRAHVRGTTIRQLAGRPVGFLCDWDRITDPESGAWFDLTDPLAPAAQWCTQNGEPASGPPANALPSLPPESRTWMERQQDPEAETLWLPFQDGQPEEA